MEPGAETQHTPSLTYFLFPPSGSGVGPEQPYPDWSQEEGEQSPSLFRLSITVGLTHPSQGEGGLQKEARTGIYEVLSAGRGE